RSRRGSLPPRSRSRTSILALNLLALPSRGQPPWPVVSRGQRLAAGSTVPLTKAAGAPPRGGQYSILPRTLRRWGLEIRGASPAPVRRGAEPCARLRSMRPGRRVLVLGGGPVGIEAALAAAHLGHNVRVLEAGRVGENLRSWGHVRM